VCPVLAPDAVRLEKLVYATDPWIMLVRPPAISSISCDLRLGWKAFNAVHYLTRAGTSSGTAQR